MTVLPFSEWLPDQGLGANAFIENVVPTADGWGALASLVDTQNETLDSAFTQDVRPAYLNVLYTSAGVAVPLVGVNKYGMFGYETNGSLVSWDIPGLTLLQDNAFRVVQWGDYAYIADGESTLRRLDLNGTRTDTIEVPEAGDDNALTFKDFVACRNFLVGAYEVHDGGIENPFSVRWSGLQRPDNWTPSVATQADQQDIPARGVVRGLTGGGWLTVLMERAIFRGDYVGPPVIWEFQELDTNIGCMERRSVIKVGETTYWLSEAGWKANSGGASEDIGLGRVDKWFMKTAKTDGLGRMSASYYPETGCVAWLFETNDAADSYPDMVLFYHAKLKRWGNMRTTARFIGRTAVAAVTWDAAPWADMSVDDPALSSPDSAAFAGGRSLPAAIGPATGELLTMTGAAMPAIVDTPEIGDGYSFRAMHRAVPILDGGGTVEVEQITRQFALDGVGRTGRRRGVNRQGFIQLHDAGRTARLRVHLSGDWRRWKGLDVS